MWLGRAVAVGFKYRSFRMSDRQFINAYKALGGAYASRGADTTRSQSDWLLAHIPERSRVLEIGPGGRTLTERLRDAGHIVVTLEKR